MRFWIPIVFALIAMPAFADEDAEINNLAKQVLEGDLEAKRKLTYGVTSISALVKRRLGVPANQAHHKLEASQIFKLVKEMKWQDYHGYFLWLRDAKDNTKSTKIYLGKQESEVAEGLKKAKETAAFNQLTLVGDEKDLAFEVFLASYYHLPNPSKTLLDLEKKMVEARNAEKALTPAQHTAELGGFLTDLRKLKEELRKVACFDDKGIARMGAGEDHAPPLLPAK